MSGSGLIVKRCRRPVGHTRNQMRSKHLSYKRAIETCLSNQDLVGAPFSPGEPDAGDIVRVMIAPYNKILQWQFVNDIINGADPERAIARCRDGKYDVIPVAVTYDPKEVKHRPKRLITYLEEQALAAADRKLHTGLGA